MQEATADWLAMGPIFSILVAFAISASAVHVMLARWVPFDLPVDFPNGRSLHSKPVPRCGGVAIMLAILLVAIPQAGPLGGLIVVAMTLSAVSYIDDLRSLPVTLRIVVHIIGAAIAALQFSLPVPAVFLLAIIFVASANVYNFMDGSNGLAAGVAVIGFSFYAFAALIKGDAELALTSAVIAAASTGFLIFNYGNARIFLGDAGSIPLGMMAGVLGAAGWSRDLWSSTFPILAFFPFIVDALATLIKRAINKRVIWHPHREHYYQRLVQMGWEHRRLALVYYGLTLATASVGLALLMAAGPVQWIGLTASIIIAVILMRRVDQHWQQWTEDHRSIVNSEG